MARGVKSDTGTAPAGFLAQAGKGRPKGVANKNTAALKDMILTALSDVGGADYLVRQAEKNPGPFLALVGKVLPMTVTGTGDRGEILTRIELVAVQPE